MISLTTGTAFIMWLGEQITERGIGNGISLIIFAGIVTDMPDAAVRMFSKAKTGDITAFDLAVIGAAHRAGRRRHHLLRTRAKTNTRPVRKTRGRAKDRRRPVDATCR